MKRGINTLTPKAIESWMRQHHSGKVSPHAKLSDGDGMYLTITKAGTPVWRLKYRHAGKEATYSIGPYPAVTLATARIERSQARALLREGKNPVQAREVQRAAAVVSGSNTFEPVARDWLKKREKQWSAVHLEKSRRALERDVFPQIGHLPVSEIRAAHISRVIEAIAGRGAVDTAGKVLQHINGVFRLAQAKDLRADNPAEPVREVLPRRAAVKPRPAMLKWPQLGQVLRGAEAARLSPVVRMAHRLCAFTVARIGNVVEAEWKEFNLDGDVPQWVIPRAKMKAQNRSHDHRIILGPTIAQELHEWRQVIGGKGYVFPSPVAASGIRKHVTRESLEKAYRVTLALDQLHTPHGWRSALSTLARDEGGFERDVVELALDHIHDNDVVRAYDRGERLTQRIALMNWWDQALVKAQSGATVIPLMKSA